MQNFDNLINGEWRAGASYSPNTNPSNLSDVLGQYAQGDAAQVDAAVAAATAAFPAWSTGSIQARSDALDKIGNEILARKEELGTLLAREEGKTKPEGIGEATRAGHIFKFFAGECLRLSGEVIPSVRPGIGVEITREPVGVVGLITPWNFPIAIPAWKIAPALAFGNCVVLKPADLVPGCAWALAEIISRSGIPPGVFNLVMGRGSVIGNALVDHPGIHAISFTGSVGVGRNIAVQCATKHKKVQLEMGGKNPQVVLDDANLEHGGRAQRAERLLFHRPALHRLEPADRDRGHLPEIHRGDEGAHGEDQGRRCAGAGHRHRPGLQREPAAAGPELHRDRPGRGRHAGRGRRAAEAGHRGLLHVAGAVQRIGGEPCASTRKRSSGRWPA
jgi:acyl-CoA reductase-like NAD-dependent aldehyde dehydrogenase